MIFKKSIIAFSLFCYSASAGAGQDDSQGRDAFHAMIGREWRTSGANSRISIVVDNGAGVLTIFSGFFNRMGRNTAYADTVQFIKPKGNNEYLVTYHYENGEILESYAKVNLDNSIEEFFQDKGGSDRKNIYYFQGREVLIIRRFRRDEKNWVSEGETQKNGFTLNDVAVENNAQSEADAEKSRHRAVMAERKALWDAKRSAEAVVDRQAEDDQNVQSQAAFQRLNDMGGRLADGVTRSDRELQAQIAKSRDSGGKRLAAEKRQQAFATKQVPGRAGDVNAQSKPSFQAQAQPIPIVIAPSPPSPIRPSASTQLLKPEAKALSKTITVNVPTVTSYLSEGVWSRVGEVAGVTIDARYRHELRDQVISEFRINNKNNYGVYFNIRPRYVCGDHSQEGGTEASGDIKANSSGVNGIYDYPCKSNAPSAIGFNLVNVTPN